MYPSWASKYKEKGMCLKKRGDAYLLYRCHSSRIKGKKYPQMVQDELIGTITKEGITYTTKRNIDIEDIIIKTFDDFKEYLLLNKKEKLLFKDTRLIKANKKFYFEKLDDSRLSILKAHSISILKGLEYDD